jgi:hypothetical protein
MSDRDETTTTTTTASKTPSPTALHNLQVNIHCATTLLKQLDDAGNHIYRY